LETYYFKVNNNNFFPPTMWAKTYLLKHRTVNKFYQHNNRIEAFHRKIFREFNEKKPDWKKFVEVIRMFEKNQRDKSEYIKAGNEIPRRKSKENFNKYNENKESRIEEIENNNEEIQNNNEEIQNNNEEIQNYEQKYTIQELLQDNKLLELIKAKLGDSNIQKKY